jgi:hypothetical protein
MRRRSLGRSALFLAALVTGCEGQPVSSPPSPSPGAEAKPAPSTPGKKRGDVAAPGPSTARGRD